LEKNSLIKILTVLFLFLAMGCVHKVAQVRSLSENDLFPNGNYQQDVIVHVLAEGHRKDFDFNCLVQKNSDSFYLVGYNSFGVSLFKIKEADGKIHMESSISEINNKKDFFLKMFSMVKTLIHIKSGDPRIKEDALDVDFQNVSSKVHFSEFDKAGIPLKIEISSSNIMNVQIVTTEYTFRSEINRH
jgi:hypothetical protein